MAKNQQAATGSIQVQAPEGFRRTGSANAVGWFDLAKMGNVLSGTLLGKYTRKDKMREEGSSDFFQVLLKAPCQVTVERGEDRHGAEAVAGDVVNVNYGPKTKPWANYISDIQNGAEYEVYGVIAGAKIKIDGGRSMHNFEVFDKQVKAPRSTESESVDFEGSNAAAE